MCHNAANPKKRSMSVTRHGIDLFSMTDEEQDIIAFQKYLHSLTPDALWDVQRHLDEDRYPRRTEAVTREIARRQLFYLTPYSPLEARLRGLFGCLLLLSALAAAFHGIASISIPLLPGEKLPYFYDLAVGGPKAAQIVLPLTRCLASLSFIASIAGIFIAVYRLARRNLRIDVFVTGIGAILLATLFLVVAYR
jgi:hypothetical protein